MRWLSLLIIFITVSAQAHEILSTTQHVNIKKSKKIGWQQDVSARVEVNQKLDVGAQATYFERFDLYEKRVGGFIFLRPTERWTFEVRYLQGKGNQILPEKQTTLGSYYSYADGLAPFLYLRDSRYSVTKLNTATAGIEIEKLPNIIIIPSFMVGRAGMLNPRETKSVYNYGLKVVFYREKNFSLTGYTFRGREASQAIIGISNMVIDTTTGGFGGSYNFTPDFKAELLIDHTDYNQLKNQFVTTTLNLGLVF